MSKLASFRKRSNKPANLFYVLGGGYAALYASTWLPGSLSISINPPLRLGSHWQAPPLSKTVGIDLDEPDALHRNNIWELPDFESAASHVIVVNSNSPAFDRDVLPMARQLGVSLNYDLTRHKNILFWIYNFHPPSPTMPSSERIPFFMP